jgi:hypothetical protein
VYDSVFVVFLKEGSLWVEECGPVDVFQLAKQHDAGICGVFEESWKAQELMDRLRTEQQRLWQSS